MHTEANYSTIRDANSAIYINIRLLYYVQFMLMVQLLSSSDRLRVAATHS